MNTQKSSCGTCKASFYSNSVPCSICERKICPQCNNCDCSISSVKQIRTLKQIVDLDSKDKFLSFEITGSLSPLLGQEPVKTKDGSNLIKTKYEFSDDTGKLPLTIWGPVPEIIFPYRYEYVNNITISGVKVKKFKGNLGLSFSKTSKVFLNTFKTKNLNYFLSEA